MPREGISGLATVLIVDGDANLVNVLTFVLTREGFVVDVALSGARAFERAKAERPHIVVLDATRVRHGRSRTLRPVP